MSIARHSPAGEEAGPSSLQWQQQCRHFTVSEIQLATSDFSESLVIGHGGFGKVYKGTIISESTPVVAAIKRLDSTSNQGATEFWAEIEMLSKLRHCHLVSLIGYCNEGQEMILVYEYIQRGNLQDHLHKLHTPLSWVQRLKICIEAARGLDYLHTGTGIKHGVIHRDVKSSNILLDESWAARISDFGLSKIGPTNQPSTYVNTAIRGTFGYLDPDYYSTGRLTRKADVYAFGVILFEVLCRKRAVDSSLDEDQWNLAIWAQDSIKGGRLKQIVDLDLRVEILPKCLKKYARLAERCLDIHPTQRPTMAEVVVSLELVLNLQVKANKSRHPAGITIFGRKVPMFLLPSKEENSGKVTSASLPPSPRSPRSQAEILQSANLKPFSFDVLKTATSLQAGKVTYASVPPSPRSPRSQAEILQSANLKPFSFNVLKAATRNFRPDNVLGEGGFGSVFKGWIDEQSLAAAKPGTGTVIAIKRLNQEGHQGHQEWLAEINYLGTLNHPNLVKLIGYCLEDDHRLLVYEFMPRGSLENYLFRRSSYFQPLSWNLRIKVALDAAKGLAYLHRPEAKVIYCGFKISNILIDSNYNAKLSDFRLAKDGRVDDTTYLSTYLSSSVINTYGYEAPEYMATGHVTARSNIYSFGVVLLEILTGRRCIDKNRPSGEQVLVGFVKPYLTSKRRILRIMDPRIDGQYSSTVALNAAILAMKCLAQEPIYRPTAEEVVNTVEQLQELQKASEVSRKEPIRKQTDSKTVSYPRPAAATTGVDA